MPRNALIIALVLIGGLAAVWLNLGGASGDPSLSSDPDTIDAYGGTVLLPGGSLDLPPPRLATADAADAEELARTLRRKRLDAIVAELGAAERSRTIGTGLASAWLDRAATDDPDRADRRVSVHLVALSGADGAVREILAVASGGRIVGRW